MSKQLTDVEAFQLLQNLKKEYQEEQERKFFNTFPDTGPYSRSFYKKHIEFLDAGATYKQRALIAGNRVGKTYCILYEIVCHLTGLYPTWWKGYRFDRPIKAWAVGVTNEAMREVLQETLLGKKGEWGTGLLPKSSIALRPDGKLNITARAGVPDTVQDIYVEHISGGRSVVILKSHQQGWETMQGANVDFVLFDEEPPYKMYSEALMRTATTKGLLCLTFTPQKCITDVVLAFIPRLVIPEDGKVSASKYVMRIEWDEAGPHFTEEEKAMQLDGMHPNDIAAKTRGIPGLGAGKIFPIQEEEIVVESFKIPDYWPRAYGMDPGFTKTAVVWIALDPNTGTYYLYDEYYRGQLEPAVHVAAIKSRGDWIQGAIDWSGTDQTDGKRLMYEYQLLGLHVFAANKAIEASLLLIYRLMCDGKFKVMEHCTNWLGENRVLHRDDRGDIAKTPRHAVDASRYCMLSGMRAALPVPDPDQFEKDYSSRQRQDALPRPPVTGY